MVSCCRPDPGSSVISHARSSQLTEWPRPFETACPLIVGRLSNLDVARSQFQRAGSTCGACSATGHYRCNAKKTNGRQPAPSRNPQLHDSSLADASASLAECYWRRKATASVARRLLIKYYLLSTGSRHQTFATIYAWATFFHSSSRPMCFINATAFRLCASPSRIR
jgi:hypothetical protein